MTLYTIMAIYASEANDGIPFFSFVDTMAHAYADRQTAEMTADLLNLCLRSPSLDDYHVILDSAIHRDRDYYITRFVVEPVTA